MSLNNPAIIFDISVNGKRDLRIGERYHFVLVINSIVINGRNLTYVNGLKLSLGKNLSYSPRINQAIPLRSSFSLSIPKERNSWYPLMFVYGIDQYGYRQEIPFLFPRPIISTNYHPVFDARLGRSNLILDEQKINLIRNLLNKFGFDCSTIGKEIIPNVPRGKPFIDFEKRWASGGHCFVSVLTRRDLTADGRLSLPPPWVVTESGLSYAFNRPHLVFIEKGVSPVALYQHIDRSHIFRFEIISNRLHLDREITQDMTNFRAECQGYDSDKRMEDLGKLVFLGFAIYGGWKFFGDFFK